MTTTKTTNQPITEKGNNQTLNTSEYQVIATTHKHANQKKKFTKKSPILHAVHFHEGIEPPKKS